MFIKQFILIIRNLWRFRLYSLLNLLGLAIALSIATLIFMYVREELSYDRHFSKAERIVRITNHNISGPRARKWANGAPLMAEHIPEYIPEIESLTRLRPVEDATLDYYRDSNDVLSQYVDGGFFADSTLPEIFDVHILHGDPDDFLKRPGTIILTQSLSEKFFGGEVPLGKSIYFQGRPWEVTAVCADFPELQHFHPTFFLPWTDFREMMIWVGLEDMYNARGWAGVFTYALLEENIDPDELRPKLDSFRVAFYGGSGIEAEEIIERGRFVLQPLLDIHLKSHLEQELEPNGNIIYVIVSSIAAIFILIIAGVNYINLAIVKALKRTREVGIRKINGASRRHLLSQFLGESLFMGLLAALGSILLMDLLLPQYNNITGMQIESLELLSFRNLAILAVIVLLLAVSSGIYPAVFASRLSAIQAVKDLKEPGSVTNRVRMGLVILQFTFSIFMILATIIIFRQMNYFLNKDMGWDKENIIAITLNGRAAGMAVDNPDVLKEEISKLSFVETISMCTHMPGDRFSVESLFPDLPEEEEGRDEPSIRFLRVDEDFVSLMGIKITRGRDLRRPSGINSEFILNEAAVRVLELKEPLGLYANTLFGQHGEIVGVSEDFHYASLQQAIEPLVLEVNYGPEFRGMWSGYLLIRISPGETAEKVELVQKKMEEIDENFVMDYTFLEDNVHKNYHAEKRLEALLNTFAILAVLISCMGLFGLSAYSAEIKTKSMGIRKVMGASITQISYLMSRGFIYYVLSAILIAFPLAYYFMNNWLRNFAFHIDIKVWEFLVAGGLAIVITALSVSYQAIKSGLANPVDSLRYE